MSRSFKGEEKELAKRNHHNRKVEDSFNWAQVKAQFSPEVSQEVSFKFRKAA